MERCAACGKELKSFSETAYGTKLCVDCWDDYLMTDRGKVEYIIGIVTGELDLKDFDADFLGHASVCWREYYWDLPYELRSTVEVKAKQLGIL